MTADMGFPYAASIGKRTPRDGAQGAAGLCRLATSFNRLNEIVCNSDLTEREELQTGSRRKRADHRETLGTLRESRQEKFEADVRRTWQTHEPKRKVRGKTRVCSSLQIKKEEWCRRGESNPRPRDYETLALPLSYAGLE